MVRHLEPELEELHQTEGRLQAVIQSAPVAILEVDLSSRVIRWNPAAEQIFGWTPDEILGLPVPIVPPSKQAEFEDVLATVRSGRRYPNVETYRQRKDGSLVDVELAAAPVRDSTGKVVSHMVVFTDITERKLQERELRASRARIVAAADTERRRLERNLHDGAQQRLVSTALLLRLAATALDEDPEGARRALDESREEVTMALAELRELARGLHPAVLTNGGLRMALESLAARAPIPVAVEGVPADRLPEAVEVAAYYLVAEALTNTAKYAGASAARVALRLQGEALSVEVSDDGVGGAEEGAGSGLCGLADRVEALGGHLEIDSPRGSGTVLRAAIPCRPPRDEILARRDPPATHRAGEGAFTAVKAAVVERAGAGGAALRVVVAEDSILLRAGVIRVLEDAGFDVVGQAQDAEALMREVRELRPDLVVTDIRMPPTYTDEGLRAVRLLRSELPGTAVLILSQYAEEAYALELLGGGVAGVGYLLKDRVSQPRAFVDAVREVGSGRTVVDPEMFAAIFGVAPEHISLEALSASDREVMARVAEGRSPAEIADELHVAEAAVEAVVENACRTLALPPLRDPRRRTLAMRILLRRRDTGRADQT